MVEYIRIHTIPFHSPPSAQIAALVERATHLVEKTALEAANKKAAEFEQESQVLSKEVASWKAKHAQAEQGALRHRCDTGFFVWIHSECFVEIFSLDGRHMSLLMFALAYCNFIAGCTNDLREDFPLLASFLNAMFNCAQH